MASDVAIQQVLAQMRQVRIEAGLGVDNAPPVAGSSDFGAVLNQSIQAVADRQAESARLAQAFERGDAGIDLASVMIAGQKSRVGFEAMVQVRNRLVEAYREIQNMQI
ncbi:MAG: flagellar hook-basal body complex protein FliE [Wenzhouxiangellaceae bacterium]|nr:flagellar hook-basal body complex protein FliE [Wenzhouxiangellaceae bacterium]